VGTLTIEGDQLTSHGSIPHQGNLFQQKCRIFVEMVFGKWPGAQVKNRESDRSIILTTRRVSAGSRIALLACQQEMNTSNRSMLVEKLMMAPQ